MPKGMQAIYTQVVGGTAPTGITFNNIPQTYTDLLIKTSLRNDSSASSYPNTAIYFNNSLSTGLLSSRLLYSTGTTAGADAESGANFISKFYGQMATSTSGIFSNGEIYIPNYTSSIFKSIILESVEEDNSTAATNKLIIALTAGLYRSNAPITSVTIAADAVAGAKFVQHSSITLYGISR